MKYVKKPIVVEAFQFGVDDIPQWFKFDKDGDERQIIYDKDDNSPQFEVITRARPGDYIIKNNGDDIVRYPAHLFEDTYRPCLDSQLEHHGFEPLTREEKKRNLDRLVRLPKV